MASSSDRLPAKVSGPALLLTVGGCAAAFASLWAAWAVGDVDWGPVPKESGWSWMLYGDVLLTISCAVVVAVAISLCLRPRGHVVGLGIGAMLLIICATLGTLVISALTSTALTDFGTVDYQAGNGPMIAIAGLAVAAAGVLLAMGAAAPQQRPAAPRWHLPGHHHRHQPRTHGM